ncbi:MAG: alpha/beta fold hydrolase [Acidobacteriota bacterium]
MISRRFAPLVFVAFAWLPGPAGAAPCATATPACTEWIGLRAGSARSLVYRNVPLTVRNEAVTRALVVVHGQGRDADNYFRSALAAAFLAGALEDTVIIAPRFASNAGSCRDVLSADEVNWACSGQSWRSGAAAVNQKTLTSYDFMDTLLTLVARKDTFPNLKSIVLTGHSAGGQYVSRYAMANLVHDTLGVPVKYVVSNPSSYGYPDANRPTEDGKGFKAFDDARNCTTYDRWPYGFNDRVGYAAQLTDQQLTKQLVTRPTVYLLGELDILPLAGFDSSCPAMAQGPTRLARGQAFAAYMAERYSAPHHTVVQVPLCGHNARCMYTAEIALPILFPAK